MSSNLVRDAWRAKKLEEGACTKCIKNPRDEGYAQCTSCREKDSLAKRAQRINRKANGICEDCGKAPADQGRSWCGECYTRKVTRNRGLAAARVATGVCPRCKISPTAPNRGHCVECLAQMNSAVKARRDARKANGLCTRCGKAPVVEGKARCSDCSAAWRARNYGLTGEQLNELIRGGCAICGSLEGLAIDHDHRCCSGTKSCGKCVRGALCRIHNTMAGFFERKDAALVKEYVDRAGIFPDPLR